MPDKRDFYAVLSAAIDDLLEHGFDSAERLARWTAELRKAAERSLVNPAVLEDMLRNGLYKTYERLVDKGQIDKVHVGRPRFTIDKVKPKLRSELDRRIMASADLIKLNREEAIAKTLQRLQGWATSIPAGGSDVASKGKAKANIRKSLAQLPFEERRVIIDQGHKLASAISSIIATDGGSIAAEWVSTFQSGYNFRKDHREINGHFFLIRNSWAHTAGLVKPGPDGYTDQIEQPAELPFCRCRHRFIYAVKDLPADMVTAKGRAALQFAREAIEKMGKVRADDAMAVGDWNGALQERVEALIREAFP